MPLPALDYHETALMSRGRMKTMVGWSLHSSMRMLIFPLLCRLRQLRLPLEGCSYPEALATSWDQFLHVANLTAEACKGERVPYAATLGYQCPLLARKFPADVSQHIFGLMTDCSSRLNISRLMQC